MTPRPGWGLSREAPRLMTTVGPSHAGDWPGSGRSTTIPPATRGSGKQRTEILDTNGADALGRNSLIQQIDLMVARDRIELPTRGFPVLDSLHPGTPGIT